MLSRNRVLMSLCLVFLLAIAAIAEPKAPLATLELDDGDTVVFLGDSITHQCLYTQYVEDFFYTRFPDRRIRFHNAGVGGDTAADALARFDRDVGHYKPKYVTVLLGMNDFRYRPFDAETFETYRRDMRRLIERIVGIGAMPVLITPTMYDTRAALDRNPDMKPERVRLYNPTLAFYGGWVREQAFANGYGFVDMYSLLNNLTLEVRKKDPQFTFIPDAVHPGAPGQLVMAFAILRDMDLSRNVSDVRIGGHGKVKVRASGGKLTDLRFSGDGLEFTFAATSLPYAIVPEAKQGSDLLRLEHRQAKQNIQVHGLDPGQYQLLIDDQPVGTYGAAKLASRIELQENMLTPQYQQALAVAELNRQRNDEAVRPLRNLWSKKKQLRHARAQLEAKPDDEQIAKRVADLEASVADFEDQIAALEEKTRGFEDRIYELNQPGPHRFRLVRLD